MNKNAIKKFAMAARTRLIATVSDRAGMLGITKDKISQPKSKGNGFEIYETAAGTENTLNRNQIHQRRRLVEQIEARGFDVVMEEIAYTWFNRICAIRFMEVNDYLPTRVRALSSLRDGKNEPDLLTEAPNVDLDFTDQEREWILTAKEQNRQDELFSMLFIKQCNKLSEILPELFEATEDYTEMLLSLSYTNKDDVIRMLVDGVDEKDFNVSTPDEDGNPTGQVEIIGWLYQYYNTELKDDTFAQLKKKIKISKERIPAATQLFTPDWIVRYMVENSVGRIWIEHLRAIDPSTDEKATAERFGWKYYLPEAEQEPEVNAKLAEIRKSYVSLKPEDIMCIDPCMGSGHIIVAQFDVLMDIYTSVGYGEREAAFEIVEHNLHGLDIDKRAYQLAYFAVMMKGRQYNRRFFRGKDDILPKPKVYAFSESNDINRAQLKYFGVALNELEKKNALNQINGLLDTFMDAREYGSTLNVENYNWVLLRKFIQHDSVPDQLTLDVVGIEETKKNIVALIDIGEVMAMKYDAVVTNPPYLGGRKLNDRILEFLTKNYSDGKADLFSAFIIKCNDFSKLNGFRAMITQQAWMFLSSYEALREREYNSEILNMAQLGTRAFDEIGGEVVQTTMFVKNKHEIPNYKGVYIRLTEIEGENNKERQFFNHQNRFFKSKESFKKISGAPIAYWASDRTYTLFETSKPLKEYVETRQGLKSSDDKRFFRLWPEVDYTKIEQRAFTHESAESSNSKWFLLNKGGHVKWYGDYWHVINWENDGYEIKEYAKQLYRSITRTITSMDYYFRESISWPKITSTPVFRLIPQGYIFSDAGSAMFYSQDIREYLLAFLNTKIVTPLTRMLNPTINLGVGDMLNIPFIVSEEYKSQIIKIAKNNIEIAKKDWDSYEISRDFTKHPMTGEFRTVKEAFGIWYDIANEYFKILK